MSGIPDTPASRAEQTAADLLSIGAVFLRPNEPFTWASGIKSPIYCDNRLTLSYPQTRERIESSLADLIRDRFPDCEALFGTATAGIAHAAICAHILGLPAGYVRGSAKDHGRGNRIEGVVTPGMRVVVIEDLVSTGGSVLETVQALRESGAEVLGVACIFTYRMKRAIQRFAEADARLEALTDFDALVETAVKSGAINAGDAPRLRMFRDNPDDPAWMNM